QDSLMRDHRGEVEEGLHQLGVMSDRLQHARWTFPGAVRRGLPLPCRRGGLAACRSFDTISLYAKGPVDALAAFEALAAYDAADCFSTPDYPLGDEAGAQPWRLAVPMAAQLEFFDNTETEALFADALSAVEVCAGAVARIDYAPFLAINALMFFGPFVAERYVSVGAFLEAHPEAGVPAVRNLILGSKKQSAVEVYQALYQVAETRHALKAFWAEYDALMVPTVGTVVTVAEALADPFTPSFNNGYYTNFANPLGLASISVPFGVIEAGVPYGVTFLSTAGSERKLTRLARDFAEAAAV
ncbi:MAG: hypothetical protein CMM76_14395, partial [Rhodospirillaceae bacterium]|nr:hypothetical protein [Rhodospirillaceae bacterium]